MEGVKPQYKLIWLWRIRLALICFVISVANSYLFSQGGLIKDIITYSWMGLFVVMFFILLPIAYNKIHYSYDNLSITLNHGMIYYRVKTLKQSNIKFSVVSQSPAEMVLGIYSLRLKAMGGDMVIWGLDKDQCNELKSSLGI